MTSTIAEAIERAEDFYHGVSRVNGTKNISANSAISVVNWLRSLYSLRYLIEFP